MPIRVSLFTFFIIALKSQFFYIIFFQIVALSKSFLLVPKTRNFFQYNAFKIDIGQKYSKLSHAATPFPAAF